MPSWEPRFLLENKETCSGDRCTKGREMCSTDDCKETNLLECVLSTV